MSVECFCHLCLLELQRCLIMWIDLVSDLIKSLGPCDCLLRCIVIYWLRWQWFRWSVLLLLSSLLLLLLLYYYYFTQLLNTGMLRIEMWPAWPITRVVSALLCKWLLTHEQVLILIVSFLSLFKCSFWSGSYPAYVKHSIGTSCRKWCQRSHPTLPTNMADTQREWCCDWLTDRSGTAALLWLVVRASHKTLLLQLKIDLVCHIDW